MFGNLFACCAQGPVFKPSTNSRQTVRSFLPALLVWIRGEAALQIKAPFTDALVISSGVLAAAALQGLGVKWGAVVQTSFIPCYSGSRGRKHA